MIQKSVRFEVEVRDSDFTEIVSRDHLEYTTIQVSMDMETIMDCLRSNDLTRDTLLTIEMISTDRRAIKYRRDFELFEFDFNEHVTLRCFTPQDVVQITFKEELEESYVVLKLSELPISRGKATPWYAQVKSKQVKFELNMFYDESAVPASEQK